MLFPQVAYRAHARYSFYFYCLSFSLVTSIILQDWNIYVCHGYADHLATDESTLYFAQAYSLNQTVLTFK